MSRSLKISILFVATLYALCFSVIAAEVEMDDFFSMSPAELANISVSIASGTAKPAYQSAAVTTVITAQQIKSMGATELDQVLETDPVCMSAYRLSPMMLFILCVEYVMQSILRSCLC